MKKIFGNSSRRIGRGIFDYLRMIIRFRGFWFWLMLSWTIWGRILSSEGLNKWVLGLLTAAWLTKVWNDNPIFVRTYGDTDYMINNSLILYPLSISILRDRMLLSLFGGLRDKVLPVSVFKPK